MLIPFRGPLVAALLLCADPALASQDWPTSIPDDVGETSTTASGLQYNVLRKGDGSSNPEMGDRVTVRYSGWLQSDGELFDSSENRGAGSTSSFELGRVIQGWNEGLQLMSPGARFKLTIPAALGYGERGSPPKIPAGATLVFVVELVSFDAKPRFVALGEEGVQKTESGIRYRVLAAGSGKAPDKDHIFSLRYSVWDLDGRLIDTSFRHGQTIDGRCTDMRLPFLQEIPLQMPLGCSLILEASKDQAFPEGLPPEFGEVRDGVTVWRLDMVEVRVPLPVPEFRLPGEAELTTTESGLRYVVLEEGVGEPQPRGTAVRMHYAGWLTDGTPFDSSFGRGQPFEVEIGGRVIPGWNEALAMMKPGAKWIVVIPPQLGYGEDGSPPVIPGNATLVFLMQMLPAGDR